MVINISFVNHPCFFLHYAAKNYIFATQQCVAPLLLMELRDIYNP